MAMAAGPISVCCGRLIRCEKERAALTLQTNKRATPTVRRRSHNVMSSAWHGLPIKRVRLSVFRFVPRDVARWHRSGQGPHFLTSAYSTMRPHRPFAINFARRTNYGQEVSIMSTTIREPEAGALYVGTDKHRWWKEAVVYQVGC
jgi:hypothetical protein